MSKKVIITDRIKDLIAKNSDGSVDPTSVSVYECVALNTLPISKQGTLFNGARTDAATLQTLAEYVNNGTSVPLHLIHDQAYGLPVGKVFYAETRQTFTGSTELRSLFYLPNTETDLITKLDTNVIDEVSVGYQPKKIACSKCGFDFLGAEATWENIWTLTCDKDHTIGVDGTYANISGVVGWHELSLVSKGAANNAKILARTKQLLGQEEYNRLAASGIRPEATILYTSATKENIMEMKELILQLTQASGSVMLKDAEIATLKASQIALQTTLDTTKAELSAMAAKQTPELTTLQASLESAKTESAAALSFIRLEADRLAVASGLEKPAADAALSVLQASIEASRSKLAALPVGGAGQGAGAGSGDKTVVQGTSSFKTAR